MDLTCTIYIDIITVVKLCSNFMQGLLKVEELVFQMVI